jgi:MFS transporter, PCFT/HCP family, solute carrier family 46 (folate transporter), member 1
MLAWHIKIAQMVVKDEKTPLISNNSTPEPNTARDQKFTIELALILMLFGWNLSTSILPNELLKQTCLMQGYNFTDCKFLIDNNDTNHIEEKVQPVVAEILMTISVLSSIVPVILLPFVVPWTDKFGRKKVMTVSFFGYCASLVALSFVSFYSDCEPVINPWLYVVPFIPMALVGGWPTLIATIFCHITDFTSASKRSSRLAIVELITYLGLLFGTASCSFVLQVTCPTKVFVLSSVCVFISALYVVMFVEESVKVPARKSLERQLSELISPKPLVEMLKACAKPRLLNERRILWSLLVILMLTAFTKAGTATVFYLFVREKFQWNLAEATGFESCCVIIYIVGCSSGMLVLKEILNFSDLSLCVVAILSMLFDAVIKAFAEVPSVMYIASGLCMYKTLIPPMCRSLISSTVPKQEVGKVYSAASWLEALFSILSSPIYTFVYEITFTSFAGAYFLITAAASLASLLLVFGVLNMQRRRESFINSNKQIGSLINQLK